MNARIAQRTRPKHVTMPVARRPWRWRWGVPVACTLLLPVVAGAQEDPPGSLTLGGVLFDSTSMAPLSGAAVYLLDTEYAAATDSQGRFGMLGVPAGEYQLSIMHVRISDLGYAVPPTWSVSVADSGTTVVRLALPS